MEEIGTTLELDGGMMEFVHIMSALNFRHFPIVAMCFASGLSVLRFVCSVDLYVAVNFMQYVRMGIVIFVHRCMHGVWHRYILVMLSQHTRMRHQYKHGFVWSVTTARIARLYVSDHVSVCMCRRKCGASHCYGSMFVWDPGKQYVYVGTPSVTCPCCRLVLSCRCALSLLFQTIGSVPPRTKLARQSTRREESSRRCHPRASARSSAMADQTGTLDAPGTARPDRKPAWWRRVYAAGKLKKGRAAQQAARAPRPPTPTAGEEGERASQDSAPATSGASGSGLSRTADEAGRYQLPQFQLAPVFCVAFAPMVAVDLATWRAAPSAPSAAFAPSATAPARRRSPQASVRSAAVSRFWSCTPTVRRNRFSARRRVENRASTSVRALRARLPYSIINTFVHIVTDTTDAEPGSRRRIASAPPALGALAPAAWPVGRSAADNTLQPALEDTQSAVVALEGSCPAIAAVGGGAEQVSTERSEEDLYMFLEEPSRGVTPTAGLPGEAFCLDDSPRSSRDAVVSSPAVAGAADLGRSDFSDIAKGGMSWDFPLHRAEQQRRLISLYEAELAAAAHSEGLLRHQLEVASRKLAFPQRTVGGFPGDEAAGKGSLHPRACEMELGSKEDEAQLCEGVSFAVGTRRGSSVASSEGDEAVDSGECFDKFVQTSEQLGGDTSSSAGLDCESTVAALEGDEAAGEGEHCPSDSDALTTRPPPRPSARRGASEASCSWEDPNSCEDGETLSDLMRLTEIVKMFGNDYDCGLDVSYIFQHAEDALAVGRCAGSVSPSCGDWEAAARNRHAAKRAKQASRQAASLVAEECEADTQATVDVFWQWLGAVAPFAVRLRAQEAAKILGHIVNYSSRQAPDPAHIAEHALLDCGAGVVLNLAEHLGIVLDDSAPAEAHSEERRAQATTVLIHLVSLKHAWPPLREAAASG